MLFLPRNTGEPCKYRLEIRSRAVISSLLLFSLFEHVRSLVHSSPVSVFPADKFLADSSGIRGKTVSTMGCLARDNNDNNDANALHRPPAKTRGATRRNRSYEMRLRELADDEG